MIEKKRIYIMVNKNCEITCESHKYLAIRQTNKLTCLPMEVSEI